jgi:hypothetical protein
LTGSATNWSTAWTASQATTEMQILAEKNMLENGPDLHAIKQAEVNQTTF